MKEDIILIGGGGHCKACIDVIEAQGMYSIAGILDIKEKCGQKVLGYEIFGCDEDLKEVAKTYKNFLITIGQIKSSQKRIEKFTVLKNMGLNTPSIISPYAYVSRYASVGSGSIVMHGAFLNAGVIVGENCIIDNKAMIEHDTRVGNHTHVSLAAIVAADVSMGDSVFIGANATIVNGITISNNVLVGAGSVVVDSITASATYMGEPAKRKK